MPIDGFYYTYGNDTDIIEKKWLPDLEQRYTKALWLRYDATIDSLDIPSLVTEYQANGLFQENKVIVIRNADLKHAQIEELTEVLLANPIAGNAFILLASTHNKTTKLGKLVKDKFIVREFTKPEIKPFDLLDALSTKNLSMVLRQSERLFEAGQNPLALFSLIFGHFLLLRQVYERRQKSSEDIARELKQHTFRVKKAMLALRYWNKDQLESAMVQLGRLDTLLRTWQYDEKLLIQMSLIKICL